MDPSMIIKSPIFHPVSMSFRGVKLMNEGGLVEKFDFLHPPYYVPETKKIDVLLNDMRNNRTRLAIVLDEYIHLLN